MISAPRLSFLQTRFDYDVLLPSEQNPQTRTLFDEDHNNKHASKCLPISMANSLGVLIRSPVTFSARWDGHSGHPAEVSCVEFPKGTIVTNHAGPNCIVIQPGWIPVTETGVYSYIKGIANDTPRPFMCMEACIESWWNAGDFGIILRMTSAGSFKIGRGEPLASLVLVPASYGAPKIEPLAEGREKALREMYKKWANKTPKPSLDYLRGLSPDGVPQAPHYTQWRQAND